MILVARCDRILLVLHFTCGALQRGSRCVEDFSTYLRIIYTRHPPINAQHATVWLTSQNICQERYPNSKFTPDEYSRFSKGLPKRAPFLFLPQSSRIVLNQRAIIVRINTNEIGWRKIATAKHADEKAGSDEGQHSLYRIAAFIAPRIVS